MRAGDFPERLLLCVQYAQPFAVSVEFLAVSLVNAKLGGSIVNTSKPEQSILTVRG